MTASIDTFAARVEQIMWPITQHGQPVSRTLNTASEGKLYQKEMSNIQAQLRSVKKDINLHMRAMRLNFDTARTDASNHSFLGAVAGKKAANHAQARDRQNLKAREHNTLLPYEALTDRIDKNVQYLDTLKLRIDQAIQSGQLH